MASISKGDSIEKPGEFLERQLREARGRIKGVEIVTGVAIVAVGIISYILTVIMLDQILVLSTGARLGLLLVFLAATVAYLVYAVVLPAFRRINLLYAARTVEVVDPSTKNSLINWLQLRHRPEEVSEPILRVIEHRAARDISRIDLQDAIHSRHLVHISYLLAAVVITFCIFSFLTTKTITTSLRRVLFPLAEIAPPTETRLTDIEPGNTEIPAGDKVVLSAYAAGRTPESVIAYISSDAGGYWEPNPLAPPSEKYGRYTLALHDRQKSFEYYLAANDFQSRVYRVRVTAAPMITNWKVTYRFPGYTEEPTRTEPVGDIDALEGTQVDIEVTTNVPVSANSGRLDLKLTRQESSVPMTSRESDPNQLLGTIVLSDDGTYRVRFSDLLGRTPPFRPVKSIRVRRDLPPQVAFVEPRDMETKLPANATATFRLSASDDYGLKRIRFVLLKQEGDKTLVENEFGKLGEPLGRSRLLEIPVDLSKFELQSGDVLSYWAEAQDSKQPAYNFTSTKNERRTILIVDPAPQKKPDEQLAKNEPRDKKEEQEKKQPPAPNQGGEADQGNPQDQPPADGTQGQGKGEGKGTSDKNAAPNKDSKGETPENAAKGTEGEAKNPPAADSAGSKEEGTDKNQSSRPDAKDSEQDRQDLEKLRQFFDKKDSKKSDQRDEKGAASKNARPGEESKSEGDAAEKATKSDAGDKGDQDTSKSDSKSKTSKGQAGKDGEPGLEASDKKTAEKEEGAKLENKDAVEKKADANDQQGKDEKETKDGGQGAKDTEKGDQEAKEKDAKPGDTSRKGGDSKSPSSAEKQAEGDQGDSGENGKTATEKKNAEKDSEKIAKKQSGDADSNSGDTQKTEGPPEERPKDWDDPFDKRGSDAKPKDSEKPSKGDQSDKENSNNKPGDKEKNPGDVNDSPKKDDSDQQKKDATPRSGDQKEEAEKKSAKPHDREQDSPKEEKNGSPKRAEKSSEPEGEPKESAPTKDIKEEKQNKEEPSKGDANKDAGERAAKDAADSKTQKDGRPGSEKSSQPGEEQGDSKSASKESNPADSKSSDKAASKGADKGDSKAGQPSEKAAEPGSDQASKQQASEKPSGDAKGNPSKGDADQRESKGEGKADSESTKPSKSGATSENKGGTANSHPETSPPGKIIDNTGDAPNPDDAKLANELTLKKLADQLKRKKVDPELLRRMGWTEEEARRFADRMARHRAPDSPPEKVAEPLTGSAREGFGKSTQLRKSVGRAGGATPQDQQRDLMQDRRTPPPPEYRELYEAYTRELAKQAAKPASPPAAPSKP